jgi:tellurite resistance protein TerC
MMDRFTYLKPAVSAILVFVGAKMLTEKLVHVPIWLSLVVILGVLTAAVTLSLVRTGKGRRAA